MIKIKIFYFAQEIECEKNRFTIFGIEIDLYFLVRLSEYLKQELKEF